MDIKSQNILYILPDDDINNIVVALGDLGSEDISSFYCPLMESGVRTGCNIKCKYFTLVVTLARLFQSSDEAIPDFVFFALWGFQRNSSNVIDDARQFMRKEFPTLMYLLD